MSAALVVAVEADAWQAAVAGAVAEGFDMPELLVGTDRGDSIEVTLRLLDRQWRSRTLQVRLDAGVALGTITDVLPGLAWSEREIAEMLGVRFIGGDDRPLLLRDAGPAPLLASTPLPARVATPWPGAAEPALREGEEGMQRRSGNPSRRRQRPPGIPDSWQEATP